ncbi:hypothetical protein SAMN03159496_01589 [Rhizobium sp. NFR07]|uniref:hypothetical protein n=1 Tax=Rhizobium sp. NFR07 TaxID=1566262 RepID=UPI0008F0064F|nr:hypothetical protein [Rhizobium sp. NFR07]SFB05535.1 hypothetical protein SAMN03159496_01589 [Rhizobium sp. NFR07]
MPYPEKPKHVFEADGDAFSERFSFVIDEGFTKDVEVTRNGRGITVDIEVTDRAVIDTTRETFEADGPVRISVTDSGLYMTTSCALLAGRVRLRRTRFF